LFLTFYRSPTVAQRMLMSLGAVHRTYLETNNELR
jgi:hypothetical protein